MEQRPLRILHIATAYPRWPGDVISPWLVQMLQGLRQRGHEVGVFTSSYRGLGSQIEDGIHVYRFRYAPRRWEILTHDMAVPERMKQGQVYQAMVLPYLASGILHAAAFPRRQDILHIHWPIPHILFGLPMRARWHAAVLLYIHGGELNFFWKLPTPLRTLVHHFLNRADLITVNSSYTRARVQELSLRVPIEIVPFGNPHATADPIPYRPKSSKRILFVGRLIEVKGLDDLLQAFQKVRKQHPDATLRIVGDGPLRPFLEALAAELGIQEAVTFTGYLTGEALTREYLEASVFVLPSKVDRIGQTETLGVVNIEALSYGIPVVASRIGGIPDVIQDGQTGLLFTPGNVEELAKKIARILESPDLARRLVEAGQAHIRTHYAWPKIIERLESLYIRCLARRFLTG